MGLRGLHAVHLGCYPGHGRRNPRLNPSDCIAIYALNAADHFAPSGSMHFFTLTAADNAIAAAAAKYRPEKLKRLQDQWRRNNRGGGN
jgi:hypothetical protein